MEDQTEEKLTKKEAEKQETKSLIEQATAAAQKLEEQNARMSELIRQQEELMARQMLGGRSMIQPEVKPVEETAKEYAAKIMKGEIKR